MTYVVIGASAGVGRLVAETLAERRFDLILISRDARDVDAVAADLALRFGIRAEGVALDLGSPLDLPALDRAVAAAGDVNGIVLAAGEPDDEDELGRLANRAERIVRSNFLSAALLLDRLLPALAAGGGGVVVGIGSVAACRGRRRNVAYAASKRALASLFESVRHRYEPEGVRVHFYHAGYLATGAAFGRDLLVPPASARAFARRIVDNLEGRSRVRYHPSAWRLACLILRGVPWTWFRRFSR